MHHQQSTEQEYVLKVRPAKDRSWPVGQIILVVSILYFSLILFKSTSLLSTLGILFMITFTSVLLRYILLIPRKIQYKLTQKGLHIESLRKIRVWPYQDLQILPSQGSLGVKISGVSTKGYYSGIFIWNGIETDRVEAIASTSQSGLLLVYKEQYYFITPADVSGFITQLKSLDVSSLSHSK